ncbi:hypothetical protein RJ639_044643 [Escallonia herrerae]|uniref:OPA3-like protein n=1 Tax=Escallonia herrerae TaxID=1293975 RepID=A0AA88WHG6_9ASTE|nr:hypothetical protein RJ639_044643 [Escallonia herrerae]
MILPVAKLGTLALKTLFKPVANRLKKEAGLHPKFRKFIVNIAQVPTILFAASFNFKMQLSTNQQANHRFTTTVQRRIYGHATDVAIHPLNEEKAVQAAADLLGELFIFTVAGAAVIFEVQRSSRAEARKEELRKQELEAMKQRDDDLAAEIELLKQKYAELEQLAQGRGLSGIFKIRNAHNNEG